MDKKFEKIAKKVEGMTPQFVETIVAGSNSGFLKGWRELMYMYKVQAWNGLEIKTEPSDIYRLQGILSGYKKLENRIDQVLEEWKNEK